VLARDVAMAIRGHVHNLSDLRRRGIDEQLRRDSSPEACSVAAPQRGSDDVHVVEVRIVGSNCGVELVFGNLCEGIKHSFVRVLALWRCMGDFRILKMCVIGSVARDALVLPDICGGIHHGYIAAIARDNAKLA
jgi:hypothetical protein